MAVISNFVITIGIGIEAVILAVFIVLLLKTTAKSKKASVHADVPVSPAVQNSDIDYSDFDLEVTTPSGTARWVPVYEENTIDDMHIGMMANAHTSNSGASSIDDSQHGLTDNIPEYEMGARLLPKSGDIPLLMGEQQLIGIPKQHVAGQPLSGISIVSAAVARSENYSAVTVNVRNDSNVDRVIQNVLLIGDLSVSILPFIHANANPDSTFWIKTGTALNKTLELGLQLKQLKTLNFMVEPDGTLQIPQPDDDMTPFTRNDMGYLLAPGNVATLTFASRVLFGSEQVHINTVPDSEYTLIALSDRGMFASINITAANS